MPARPSLSAHAPVEAKTKNGTLTVLVAGAVVGFILGELGRVAAFRALGTTTEVAVGSLLYSGIVAGVTFAVQWFTVHTPREVAAVRAALGDPEIQAVVDGVTTAVVGRLDAATAAIPAAVVAAMPAPVAPMVVNTAPTTGLLSEATATDPGGPDDPFDPALASNTVTDATGHVSIRPDLVPQEADMNSRPQVSDRVPDEVAA